MEREKTIFDFLGSVFLIYGITTAILIVICWFFGDMAREVSDMFSLGKEGLSLKTMGQFLITSFIVTGLQYLFFSERIIRYMSGTRRALYMFLSVLFMTSVAIWLFGWFPVNMWEPWVCFFLCFALSITVSIFIMYLKNRTENRKLEEGLARMREKLEEEKDNER